MVDSLRKASSLKKEKKIDISTKGRDLGKLESVPHSPYGTRVYRWENWGPQK